MHNDVYAYIHVSVHTHVRTYMCIYVITLRSCARFTSWLGMSLIRIPRNCFICDIEGASCAECEDSNHKQSGKSHRAQDFRIG